MNERMRKNKEFDKEAFEGEVVKIGEQFIEDPIAQLEAVEKTAADFVSEDEELMGKMEQTVVEAEEALGVYKKGLREILGSMFDIKAHFKEIEMRFLEKKLVIPDNPEVIDKLEREFDKMFERLEKKKDKFERKKSKNFSYEIFEYEEKDFSNLDVLLNFFERAKKEDLSKWEFGEYSNKMADVCVERVEMFISENRFEDLFKFYKSIPDFRGLKKIGFSLIDKLQEKISFRYTGTHYNYSNFIDCLKVEEGVEVPPDIISLFFVKSKEKKYGKQEKSEFNLGVFDQLCNAGNREAVTALFDVEDLSEKDRTKERLDFLFQAYLKFSSYKLFSQVFFFKEQWFRLEEKNRDDIFEDFLVQTKNEASMPVAIVNYIKFFPLSKKQYELLSERRLKEGKKDLLSLAPTSFLLDENQDVLSITEEEKMIAFNKLVNEEWIGRYNVFDCFKLDDSDSSFFDSAKKVTILLRYIEKSSGYPFSPGWFRSVGGREKSFWDVLETLDEEDRGKVLYSFKKEVPVALFFHGREYLEFAEKISAASFFIQDKNNEDSYYMVNGMYSNILEFDNEERGRCLNSLFGKLDYGCLGIVFQRIFQRTEETREHHGNYNEVVELKKVMLDYLKENLDNVLSCLDSYMVLRSVIEQYEVEMSADQKKKIELLDNFLKVGLHRVFIENRGEEDINKFNDYFNSGHFVRMDNVINSFGADSAVLKEIVLNSPDFILGESDYKEGYYLDKSFLPKENLEDEKEPGRLTLEEFDIMIRRMAIVNPEKACHFLSRVKEPTKEHKKLLYDSLYNNNLKEILYIYINYKYIYKSLFQDLADLNELADEFSEEDPDYVFKNRDKLGLGNSVINGLIDRLSLDRLKYYLSSRMWEIKKREVSLFIDVCIQKISFDILGNYESLDGCSLLGDDKFNFSSEQRNNLINKLQEEKNLINFFRKVSNGSFELDEVEMTNLVNKVISEKPKELLSCILLDGFEYDFSEQQVEKINDIIKEDFVKLWDEKIFLPFFNLKERLGASYYGKKNNFEQFFKEIFSKHLGMDRDKVDNYLDIFEKIDRSPAQEIQRLKQELISQILETDDPHQVYKKIESIFIKNNLPIVGKVFKVFEVLNSPRILEEKLSKEKLSPCLKSSGEKRRYYTIYRDLLRINLESGNRSLRDYLQFLQESEKVLSIIDKKGVDNLTKIQQKRAQASLKKIRTLFVNSRMPNAEEMPEEKIDIEGEYELLKQSLDVKPGQTIMEAISKMFLKPLEIKSLQDALQIMKDSKKQAHERGVSLVDKNKEGLSIESGDLLKGVSADFIDKILQNGSVAREFLGSSSDSDMTPFDTDLSMVLSGDVESFKTAYSNSIASGYGDLLFCVKDRGQFQKTKPGDKPKYDNKKWELFNTGGERHYGIRTGFPTTEIDFMIVRDDFINNKGKISNLFFEIAANGWYMPITDTKGKIIFTPELYEEYRKIFNGLEKFDGDPFKFKKVKEERIYGDIKEIEKDLVAEKGKIKELSKKIRQVVEEVLSEEGIVLKDEFDSGLLGAELLDTGSTARHTNSIGDFDFDLALRIDDKDVGKVSALVAKLRDRLGGEDNNSHSAEKGGYQLRLKEVDGLGDKLLDIDIGIIKKSGLVYFGSHEAVKERLEWVKENIGEDEYNETIANVILAKKILKSGGAYKKFEHGGIGGIGVENWILQNNGNIVNAFKSFIKTSHDGKGSIIPFEQFKEKYKILDPGINLKNLFHDNFIGILKEGGYKKMVEVIEDYLKSKS